MTPIAAAAHFLAYVLAGTYFVGTGLLLSAWLFLYREPDRSWKQPLAVLAWPAAALVLLIRWAFTGKSWNES